MKLIGMIGSRTRNTESDFELMLEKFDEVYGFGDSIVSGGCPTGGDHFAEAIASELGMEVVEVKDGWNIEPEENTIYIHVADWSFLGKAAGFIRNKYIARDSDCLICLKTSNEKPGGAENTVKVAKHLGMVEGKDIFLI